MLNDFSWVVPDLLAAMGRPRSTRHALESLKDEGIDVIVSLTETPLADLLISEFGFDYVHIPVEDFAAPTPEQIDRFVGVVAKAKKEGKRVVVHCQAGRGRTGTMLACYLVSEGRSAQAALGEVRRLRRGSVETEEQETAIAEYEQRMRRKSR